MAIVHRGYEIPYDAVRFDPDGSEWLAFGWDADVSRHGAIVPGSTVWGVPAGLVNEEAREDVNVTDSGGNTVQHATMIRVSEDPTAPLTPGRYAVACRVSFTDGTTLERSYGLVVADI